MEGLRPIYLDGRRGGLPPLSPLIDRLGTPKFSESLFEYFNQTWPVEHCGVYVLQTRKLIKQAALSRDGSEKSRHYVDLYIDTGNWLSDPTMKMIGNEGNDHDNFLVEVDTTTLGTRKFREDLFLSENMRHRLLVCLKVDEGIAVLDMVSSYNLGSYPQEHLGTYGIASDIILPLVLKHVKLANDRVHIEKDILKDISAIESRLKAKKTYLPPRERQVAARILYGQSTLGIAIDLGVGKETVSTYRKRLYSRLNISSERELSRWFIYEG